jgi:hypothetical protein
MHRNICSLILDIFLSNKIPYFSLYFSINASLSISF